MSSRATGRVVWTPKGRLITIDGGDNPLFARFLAARFRGSSYQARQEIDAMVVTHGDADHFSGLVEDPGERDRGRPRGA